MKQGIALLVGVVLVLSLVPLAQASAGASASSSSSPSSTYGYVAYRVQSQFNNTHRAALVNESVSSSSHAGESVLQLAIDAASGNLTYSRLINSSATVFPFVPGVSNQTFGHSGRSANVTGTLVQRGTTQVTFRGKSYTLTDYTFTVTYASTTKSGSARGNISAFPSGLIYAVAAESGNSALFSAVIVATSLPLQDTAASPSVQLASAGVGASVAIAAVAFSLGVRYRQSRSKPETRSDHWVD